ncbi:hypothetical protein A9P82_06090 [Arachidicoccus ginsenosidimutans]|uniref:FKBP-type peptidyl-prolyl cis-trans isomerase n=1 Tax=Arachidicoccus sp. BS20 TaxID=1850526 RepID=UPI0007F061F9|nr:FKBP-type peptidyl-prolyl cis-trans isomerase [Arachidicoccus sp. BS20]ANI88900.1 hypothetical protein A9P82_06090 [Arachidicoccus sp. BS20]
MRKLLCASAGLSLLALASCNLNYSTTKSGIKYKIFSGKAAGAEHKGDSITVGDIVKFNIKVTIPEQDTTLADFYGKMPQYAPLDTGARAKMSIMEIMPKMQSGDSAVAMLSMDSIIAKNPMGLPPFIKKGQHIKYTISILNVFKNDSIARLDVNKERDKEQAREKVELDAAGTALDKYITDNNIKATKTKNGVYVVLDTPGDISLKADSGMQATVNYTGRVVGGTKPFDSNVDTTFHHAKPLEVVVDSHQTIPGWDEALPYFGKGAKGKIYIPAKLAYGAQQAGPDIKPYSNLVFDIEVTDVKKPEAPKTPAMTPEMQKQLQEKLQHAMPAHK